jgi:hypothetical protein
MYLVFAINFYIDNNHVDKLAAFVFLINLCQGIQNIALDGMQITSLSREFYGRGIAMIMIGRNIGSMLAFNLFIDLN